MKFFFNFEEEMLYKYLCCLYAFVLKSLNSIKA
mgnify:CR=1 FL=1